jgi:mobilome CxxCx(11)CxxC protein
MTQQPPIPSEIAPSFPVDVRSPSPVEIQPLSVAERRLNHEASTKAVEAYGTARLFEKRALWYRKLNKIRDVLGIGVPAMVGIIVGSFSFAPHYIEYILTAAGLFAVCQLSLSVLSIVYMWDEGYSYARESLADNNRIRNRLEFILRGGTSLENRQALMDELRHNIEAREKEDEAQGLSDHEKCYGRRQGLAQYGKECNVCKKVPQIGKMKHSLCVLYRKIT